MALPLYYCLSLSTVQLLPCLLTDHCTTLSLSTVQLLPCLLTDHCTTVSVCLLSSYYPVCLLTTALPLYYCLSLSTVQLLPCLFIDHGTATVLLLSLSTVQLLPCLLTDHCTTVESVYCPATTLSAY